MHTPRNPLFRPSLLAVTISTALISSPILADEAADEKKIARGNIEVLEVTAQKRVENVQEVPIAISAFSSETMKRIGAESINDLGNIAPGLETNVTTTTQPRYDIRGIKTDDFGIGADPAVAVYVDGVYAGRSGAALVNFNDVERVEVLKGPQGTLFGRNTAAGAIHIITKRPIDDYEGHLSATLGNHGTKKVEGVYNFPVAKDLYFRGSMTLSEHDGYIDARLYPNPREGGLGDDNYKMIKWGKGDEQTLRGALYWDASAETDVILRAEFNETMNDGRPNYSFNPTLYRDRSGLDPYGVYETDFASFETRHMFGTSLEVTSDMGFGTFTSITAFKRFDTENYTEDDGSANPRSYFASDNIEKQEQFSQEFRLNGITDGGIKWTVGANYMNEDIYQETRADFTVRSLDSFALLAGGVPAQGITSIPVGTGLTNFLQQLMPNELAYLASLTGSTPQAIASSIAMANIDKPWTESTFDIGDYTSYALFTDVTYPVTDKLDLTVGVRWTRDEKDFGILSEYQNYIDIPIPGVPPALFGLAFGTEYYLRDESGNAILDAEGNRQYTEQSNTWSKVTPRIVLDYQFTDDVMAYITYAEGFKAGGFNSLGLAKPFNQEEVDNAEVGMKSTWLDNTLKVNVSAFSYDYTNLQQLKLTGAEGAIPVYNVRNVDAAGKGLELESTWAATDNLNLTLNYAFLDTEYTKYSLFTGENSSDDRTGEPLSGVPRHRVFVAGDYFIPVDNGEVLVHLDWTSVDERSGLDATNLAELTYDPATVEGLTPGNKIDGYNLMNARISYISDNDWKLSLFARNLLDENYMYSTPGGQGGEVGSPSAIRGKPRHWGIEYSMTF